MNNKFTGKATINGDKFNVGTANNEGVLTANALYTSKYGYTALRLDARNEAVYSNLLGTQEWAEEGLFSGDSIFTNGDSRFNTEFAVSHGVEKGRFSTSLTAGIFNSSRFGTFFIPGFNTTLKLGKEKVSSYLFASANRSVRQPSFTDLYYSIGGAQGSQDLKPELSNNYEAGFRIIYKFNSGGKIGPAGMATRTSELIFQENKFPEGKQAHAGKDHTDLRSYIPPKRVF